MSYGINMIKEEEEGLVGSERLLQLHVCVIQEHAMPAVFATCWAATS